MRSVVQPTPSAGRGCGRPFCGACLGGCHLAPEAACALQRALGDPPVGSRPRPSGNLPTMKTLDAEARARVARGWTTSGISQAAYAREHGIGARTLRAWLAELDRGGRPGLSRSDAARLRRLVREAITGLEAVLTALEEAPPAKPLPPTPEPQVHAAAAAPSASAATPMPHPAGSPQSGSAGDARPEPVAVQPSPTLTPLAALTPSAAAPRKRKPSFFDDDL